MSRRLLSITRDVLLFLLLLAVPLIALGFAARSDTSRPIAAGSR